MEFIKKENILSIKGEQLTRDQAIQKVSDAAMRLGVVTSSKEVFDAFVARENQGTTGFEDGFAIPHARSKSVKKAQIFIVRSMEGISDWETLDKKPVNVAIFLLIPIDAGNLHMDILSAIAMKLMDEAFRDDLKAKDDISILLKFKDIIKNIVSPEKEETVVENEKEWDSFVAITACPAGIAKTFMAKEKIEKTAKKLKYNVHVETQGGGNLKTPMSVKQIKEAKFVIVASEIKIDLDRFMGKKVIVVKTADAIHDCANLIERAEVAEILSNEKMGNKKCSEKRISSWANNTKLSVLQIFNKPWTYLTIIACLYAVIGLVGFSIFGNQWIVDGYNANKTLFILQTVAFKGFELCMALFAAIFAKKLYDSNKVFVLTFIVAFIFNTPIIGALSVLGSHGQENQSIDLWFSYGHTFDMKRLMGTSLFGGMLFAPIIALATEKFDSLSKKISDNKTTRILLLTWVNYLFAAIILITAVFLAAPFAWVFQYIIKGLVVYPNSYWWLRFIIGGIFGLLITQDYGGTINKFTILGLIGLTQFDWRMRTLIAIGIPIASISCGFYFKVFRKKIIDADLEFAVNSEKLGKKGLSEGPLSFVNKYGWKAHLPSMCAAFVAAGFIYTMNIQIFKGGAIGVMVFGGQVAPTADIIHGGIITNDIGWIDHLIRPGKGVETFFASFAFGIVGYYLSFILGILVYFTVASITLNIGKKIPFKRKGVNI